uniref:hypothetical protein n=1 Tax=Aquidulcibacter sp. TaxID=2052990 RepID=UPI0028B21167
EAAWKIYAAAPVENGWKAAMRAAITAAIEASGLVEENARLREEVARLETLQEFWHGCVVLARRQLEEASQRLDKWMKERPTND